MSKRCWSISLRTATGHLLTWYWVRKQLETEIKLGIYIFNSHIILSHQIIAPTWPRMQLYQWPITWRFRVCYITNHPLQTNWLCLKWLKIYNTADFDLNSGGSLNMTHWPSRNKWTNICISSSCEHFCYHCSAAWEVSEKGRLVFKFLLYQF